MAKANPLDNFLDSPRKKSRACTTCVASDENPILSTALKRFEERRGEGTTTVSVRDFWRWLIDQGLLKDAGSHHKLYRHFRECKNLDFGRRG